MKPFSRLSCKIGVFSCSRSNCSNSSPAPKIHPRQNGRAVGISIIGFAQLSHTVLLSTCIQYSIILYDTILYYMVSIRLNDKTKLPTDVERALVEIGGADLNATLTRHELSEALVKAIDFIGGHNPVPHPVSWTHVCATRHGVARMARALRLACDTPAFRGASTGCRVRRTQRRPRAPRRGFERPGRRRLAP